MNEQQSPRRRVHDVVIWQEQDEWVVYDSIADKCYRFDDHTEAIAKFKNIKALDPSARVML